MKRLAAVCAVLSLMNLACYSYHTISKEELDRLESGQESEEAMVTSVEGDQVEISPETPLDVQVSDGNSYRVTPYNFSLTDTQLVAPDYDLLLPADAVVAAEVQEMSYGKTFGLVGGIVAAVAGGFVALALTQ